MIEQLAELATSYIDTLAQQYRSASQYDRAIYLITVDGIDITRYVRNRLISLTITDHRGLVADSLDLELSDTDGLLDIPPSEPRSRHGSVGRAQD